MKMITIVEVKALVKYAQKYLGIQDWTIHSYLSTQKELNEIMNVDNQIYLSEIYGLIMIHENIRNADLYLWDRLDESPLSHGLAHTIFHELLHIIIKPLNSTYDLAISVFTTANIGILQWIWNYHEEIIINQLATAITKSLNMYEDNPIPISFYKREVVDDKETPEST